MNFKFIYSILNHRSSGLAVLGLFVLFVSVAIAPVAVCADRNKSLNRDTEKDIEALKTTADKHLVQGKLDIAETELLEVLRRYRAIGFPNLHYTYDLLGLTYRNKGNFSKAIFYGLKTIESMEATHDTAAALTFYSRLANMYRELGQHEKSVEWYKKLLKDRRFTDGRNIYIFRDAGFLARELIKLKKEDEALNYILDIKAKNKPIGVHAEASLLASLAYCYDAARQNREADKYYLALIKLAPQLKKDNEVTTDVNYELGRYFINKQQYAQAGHFLQQALNASPGTNSASTVKDIYLMLYKVDSAGGNYFSATQNLMKNKILGDSIFNETKSRQIEELQVQYETAQKVKDIELLNNQNQLQRVKVDNANKIKNITLAGVVLLLIIMGLLFSRYRTKQKSNRVLEAHQQELDQKNIYLEKLNNKQEILLKEKEWLIKEVHHRVKNNLQMVTSLLYSQSVYLSDDAARVAVNDSLRRMQAMSLIHQKLYQDENTATIAISGYISELLRYLHESFDSGNEVVFEQHIEPLDLDVAQAVPLGLIITESIVNAIKYAFLNEQKGIVTITLKQDDPGYLLLKISDNGIGLPAAHETIEHKSLGLDLMKGLAKQLNGSFYIENNNGVHITVKFAVLDH
ncbi:histidine kinase dimerization/phosphoacceptor domain -containing protein [Mucilaginibacter celer]|uniref:histidine kinase n=1 Tax=Mucilaginibacter celer TaxID=2305508 RepID=A0A494VP41_9SPHI|nr:histidine kinase dimerization/phosphoacceptor domain -containing protein [Mucilaginibacter celer]AYL95571.1 histidine kinase [Mucilaginibacter celer]